MNKGKNTNIEEMDFEVEEQKQIAIEVAKILEKSGKTQKDFAADLDLSLATFTNIFRPSYKKVPSIKVIRKIAAQTDSPEETYNKLMQIAHPDNYQPYRTEFPGLNTIDLRNTAGAIRDVSIIFRFISKIKTDYDKEVVLGELSNRGIPRLATIDFSTSDMPIDEWSLEFHTGFGFPAPTVYEFFYRILKEGKRNVKYSFITNSQQVYDELTSFTTNIIEGIYISVILCKNGTFTETYMTPNHTELDKAGLSL